MSALLELRVRLAVQRSVPVARIAIARHELRGEGLVAHRALELRVRAQRVEGRLSLDDAPVEVLCNAERRVQEVARTHLVLEGHELAEREMSQRLAREVESAREHVVAEFG